MFGFNNSYRGEEEENLVNPLNYIGTRTIKVMENKGRCFVISEGKSVL